MEKLGLSPEEVHKIKPSIIFVRLSGYGNALTKYTHLAGHDMNYLAVSGILNKFKRTAKNSIPVPPSNLLADFYSGSLYCFNLVL